MSEMPEWLKKQWRELVAKQQQHPHSREPGEDDGDPTPAWTPSPADADDRHRDESRRARCR